jgi:hypothetical protein
MTNATFFQNTPFRAAPHLRRMSTLCATAAIALALQACGGGHDADNTATVYFQPDTATCAQTTWRLSMYIDGSLVGTETIAVGNRSSAFKTSTGGKVMTAVELLSGSRFATVNKELSAGDEFTLLLSCA